MSGESSRDKAGVMEQFQTTLQDKDQHTSCINGSHQARSVCCSKFRRDLRGAVTSHTPVLSPRNSKSGHQLIQNTQAGILSLSPG